MDSFRVALVTWNVGGAQPGIVPGTSTLLRSANHADVIVVGLQEVAVGRRGWKTELLKALGPAWVCVGGESYLGMRLKAFARVNNGKPIVSVTPGSMRVGVGFGDRWPNKGAVAVEMRFGAACRVIFVVAHLAANEDQVQGRADDWRAILRRLDRDQFLARTADSSFVVPLFHQYDHVFVLGDLNYRVVPPQVDRDTRIRWVQKKVLQKDWASLVAVDQLSKERLCGKVFTNFQEAGIDFPPTFKIDPRTGQYSANRVPSYCDRILWHSLPSFTDLVKCVQYQPLLGFKQSDHLPLYGEFELQVPIVMPTPRPLRNSKGIRIVLEFTLVRFLKGASTLVKRESFDERPKSMRRIEEKEGFTVSSSRDRKLALNFEGFLDDIPGFDNGLDRFLLDEDEDESDDEVGEELEDDGDASSSSSSSDEDESLPNTPNSSNENTNSNCVYIERAEVDFFPQENCLQGSAGPTKKTPPPGRRGYNVKLLASSVQKGRDGATKQSVGMESIGTPGTAKKDNSNSLHFSSASSSRGTQSQKKGSSPSVAGTNDGPRKRDSLSRQVAETDGNQKKKKRSRLNVMRMEVHGQGLFLKRKRVYEVGIPKRKNGTRERIGDSLPAIPLAPLNCLKELEYRHVLLEFAKKKSRVGTSGVLPLRPLLPYVGTPYAFELFVTKYGTPVGTVEACVQLTVSDCGHWVDSQGRVVRLFDGSSAKNYRGPLLMRKRSRARSKPDNGKRR